MLTFSTFSQVETWSSSLSSAGMPHPLCQCSRALPRNFYESRIAGNLIEQCVAHGTAHLRTHVDIDLESGLAKLEGVLAARERYCDRATVQIVAFPQSGVMRCPGVLDLLDAAVRNGADLVGGIDPLEIDRDPKGQLDGIFAIAARRWARHSSARAGRDGPLQCPGDLRPH